MWPVGASNPISQRTMPIQVTAADSMTARIAIAYLLDLPRLFPRNPFTERSDHLSVQLPLGPPSRRASETTSQDPIDDPACHQRIGDEHGPAPGHRYIKSDR